MFNLKKGDSDLLLLQLDALMERVDPIADYANASSLLNWYLDDINWVGFYLWNDKLQELILGPFQGRPACVRIKPESGVCGTSYSTAKTVRVDDVNTFPGHIACDSASQSEIVIPLIKDDLVIGVLDIDSTLKGRFSPKDQIFLEKYANLTVL